MAKGLNDYMRKYFEIQEDIIVIYRPTADTWWNDRCLYRGEKYDPLKPYNHRMILDKEIVIEFDDEDQAKNLLLAEEVVKKLKADKIKYSLWHSGNKSYHVHFMVDTKGVTNLSLLKKVLMRYYTKGLELLPDLQLASPHPVRAEYGLHEKSGGYKTRLRESPGYPELAEIKQEVWDYYSREVSKVYKWRMSSTVADLSDSTLIKKLLDTTYFNDSVKDGRERIMFVLANVLAPKYEAKELIKLLTEWYHYTRGSKMTDGQIAYKVYRAKKNPYNISEVYLRSLLEDLGVDKE